MINREQNNVNITTHAELLDAIVIGAGPSGLSAGYHLKKSNLSYVIVEASNGVLSSYRYMWDNFKIAQPVKEILVDGLDITTKYSIDHQLKKDELVRVYEDFAIKHQLKIHFSEKVESINKTTSNAFEIKTKDCCYTAKNVIMALSMNAKSRYPDFISIETLKQYKQIMMHSAWYQGAAALITPKNSNILVVGSGLYALTVAKELREHRHNVMMACGYDDKQIAEKNQHLPSIPIKLVDLTKMGITNFGKLTGLHEQDKLSFAYKNDYMKIADFNKIVFATGYTYSPGLICQLLEGCIKDVKEQVLNHVNGVMPSVPGIYLVGMPLKGRNTTTFTEGDKLASNVTRCIVEKNAEMKIENMINKTSSTLSLAFTVTLFNQSVPINQTLQKKTNDSNEIHNVTPK